MKQEREGSERKRTEGVRQRCEREIGSRDTEVLERDRGSRDTEEQGKQRSEKNRVTVEEGHDLERVTEKS